MELEFVGCAARRRALDDLIPNLVYGGLILLVRVETAKLSSHLRGSLKAKRDLLLDSDADILCFPSDRIILSRTKIRDQRHKRNDTCHDQSSPSGAASARRSCS